MWRCSEQQTQRPSDDDSFGRHCMCARHIELCAFDRAQTMVQKEIEHFLDCDSVRRALNANRFEGQKEMEKKIYH